MQFRKLSLMSLAVAAIALAVTMDAHAATLAAHAVLNSVDVLAFMGDHGMSIPGAAGLGAMAIGSTTSADAAKLAKSKIATSPENGSRELCRAIRPRKYNHVAL